jgi:hypothetical protein
VAGAFACWRAGEFDEFGDINGAMRFAYCALRTYFAFRIDIWDSSGDNLAEHLAGIEDFAIAVAAYWAAIQSRPKDKITLRQGARVVLKSWVE